MLTDGLNIFRQSLVLAKHMLLCLSQSPLIFVCSGLLFDCGETQAQPRFFDSNGAKIAYTDEGEGDSVVLLHGLTSTPRLTWEIGGIGVISALSKDYRVLALHLRGHGKSDKPRERLKYGLDTVKDVIRLLDHLNIARAHIIGYSFGGGIALKLLATYPERVISAIIGGAGWTPRPGGDLSSYEKWAAGFDQGTVGPMIASLTPEGEQPPSLEQIGQMDAAFAASNDLKALAALLRSTRELIVAEGTLRANTVPTLVLIGERDSNKAAVDALSEVMANLEVVVIEEATHASALMHPSFIPAIREFLAKHHE